MLPYLYMYTPQHQEAGKELQSDIVALEALLKTVIDGAWALEDEEEEMEITIPRPRPPTVTTPKPDLPTSVDWRVTFLET